MTPELAKFLEHVQKRAFTGSGIGTAGDYVSTVLAATEAAGFCRQFPGKSAADFRTMLKAASEKFVHRPNVLTPLASVTKAKRGGQVETFGTPVRKNANALTATSVMDFENILTTKGQDRDGDILHPKGGKVDPSAPLLWQHIPTEPIGKLVQVVEQDDDHIKTHCAIADTALGNDAAALVEFGALRISHGFKPLKWKALSDEGDSGMITGWEVEEFEVMEISLVSVPANVGAVITAFSKQKLHSPLIKSWANRLYDERPALVRSGFGGGWKGAKTSPVVVNVNVNDGGKKSKPDTAKGKKEDDKDDDEDKKPKKEEGKEEPKTEEKPKDDAAEGKAGNLLSEVAQRAADMGEDESLSNEVRARCNVVAGILSDVGADITRAMEQISAFAENQDLAGLAGAHGEMIAGCGKRLQRAAAELASLLQASDDLEEGAAGAVQEMAESIGAALSGIIPAGQEQDSSEGGTGDWVQLEGEEGDDKDDDSSEEEEEEEEDPANDEDEKEDDDEESEEKDDEDEESEDKDDEEEEDKDDEADEEKDDSDSEREDDDSDDSELEDDDDKEDDGDDWKELNPEEENPEADGEENPGVDDDKEDDADDEKADDEDDDEEKEASSDKDDDGDEEPAKRPKGKKPKAADLNQMARKLTASALSGEPFKLADHQRFATLVLAGGSVDSEVLLMYRQTCGALLNQKAKTKPKK